MQPATIAAAAFVSQLDGKNAHALPFEDRCPECDQAEYWPEIVTNYHRPENDGLSGGSRPEDEWDFSLVGGGTITIKAETDTRHARS